MQHCEYDNCASNSSEPCYSQITIAKTLPDAYIHILFLSMMPSKYDKLYGYSRRSATFLCFCHLGGGIDVVHENDIHSIHEEQD